MFPPGLNALIRRVETLTKSAAPEDDGRINREQLIAGESDLQIDDRLSVAFWKDQKIDLSLTQFWILVDLARHAGIVRSIDELMRAHAGSNRRLGVDKIQIVSAHPRVVP